MPTIDDILRADRRPSTLNKLAAERERAQQPSIFDRLTQEPLPMEGRLSFLPAMVTPERGREWALPGVVAGAWNAFTAPGRALAGQELGPDEALNVAGTAMLGGMPVAPAGRGVVGMGISKGRTLINDSRDIVEPALAEGMTRLYRGGGNKGAWYTPQREVAEHFFMDRGGFGQLRYVDVPTAHAARFAEKAIASGKAIPDESAHILPSGVRQQSKVLAEYDGRTGKLYQVPE